MAPYTDWADWAGDHPEQAEAQLRAERQINEQFHDFTEGDCEHAEVTSTGHCEDCGIEVEGFEPDDAQLLTQFGTKEPMTCPAS
jgi:hypothetical protein